MARHGLQRIAEARALMAIVDEESNHRRDAALLRDCPDERFGVGPELENASFGRNGRNAGRDAGRNAEAEQAIIRDFDRSLVPVATFAA